MVPEQESVGIGTMAEHVTEHESKETKDGRQSLRLRFNTLKQVKAPELREFLTRCL